MTELDRRFALMRDGTPWYAARVADRDFGHRSFRVSRRGKSRDAHGGAEPVDDIETLVRRIVMEGARMRCTPGASKPCSSLDLSSRGVTCYVMDPALAVRLGMPASGAA